MKDLERRIETLERHTSRQVAQPDPATLLTSRQRMEMLGFIQCMIDEEKNDDSRRASLIRLHTEVREILARGDDDEMLVFLDAIRLARMQALEAQK